jgi:hypothetical protein
MEVRVDDRPLALALGPGSSLRELLQDVRSRVRSEGRIVVSVTLDGAALGSEKERELGEQAPGAAARLEFRTADAAEFSRETLAGLIAETGQVERLHDEAAEKVIAGRYDDALATFEACFRGWSLLSGAVRDILSLVPVDLAKLDAAGEPASARIRKVVEGLELFRKAFAARDVVRIADVAQYELRPRVADWRAVLEALRAAVRAKPGGGA